MRTTNADFKIQKLPDSDLYVIIMQEQVFDGADNQMTDVIYKMFVGKSQLVHIKDVIDRVLLK